ncbi:hypothetical protein EXS66_02770 [Candidatus Saccharibacteria bacterium]|nr:hypothetical protein [Candidatus Saccharibacteria bacterium]
MQSKPTKLQAHVLISKKHSTIGSTMKYRPLKIFLAAGLAFIPRAALGADPIQITLPSQGLTVDQLVVGIINILIYVSGAASVITIIVGGIMMTVSAGNDATIAKARNAILYAVIGLVVSILAFSILNFVLAQF